MTHWVVTGLLPPHQVPGDVASLAMTRRVQSDTQQGRVADPPLRRVGMVWRAGYTAKEVPQPQAFLALGFSKTKPLPLRPSEKSSCVPTR